MNVSRDLINNLECVMGKVKSEWLIGLAKIYNISIEDLLNDSCYDNWCSNLNMKDEIKFWTGNEKDQNE